MKKNNFVNSVLIYNADTDKYNIYKENRNKSGIYRWINKINGEVYIGSSISLTNRFYFYYSLNCLKNNKNKSNIYCDILKYGYHNFVLEIIEYCEVNMLLEREQYYIDYISPKYNIKKVVWKRIMAIQENNILSKK